MHTSMILIPEIVGRQQELTSLRRDIHAHPELAFEEGRTAEIVAEKLGSWGIRVTCGVGETGVVGTLSQGSSDKSIGLRADMDALPMTELNNFAHRSKTPGKMHGCGHDGHTVMLLAAAQYLAETRQFNGTVQFIFQPAEEANEAGSGAKAMIDDGLFERFPVDCIFGMHNSPALATGVFGTRLNGPIMASMDRFEVTVEARGTHAAFPHTGTDPIVIAAQLVCAWQTIVSRNIDPLTSAVISATGITTEDSWNVIPATVTIKGSIRTLSSDARDLVRQRFFALTEGIAKSFGAKAEIDYVPATPVGENDLETARFARAAIDALTGSKDQLLELPASMGSEDFAYFLQERPGCYLVLGGGGESALTANERQPTLQSVLIDNPCMLHDPNYDFNDEIIPIGASFFAKLVEEYLDG